MRATPPSRRMSAGTRSSAITAAAPASSAIFACSGVTTSMMTPPLSISARPALTVKVASSRVLSPLVLMRGECSRSARFRADERPALFVRDGDGVRARTRVCDGPWDPGSAARRRPGGAARTSSARRELDGTGLRLAAAHLRVRPPGPAAGRCAARSSSCGPGRRVTLLDGALLDPDGQRGRAARGRCSWRRAELDGVSRTRPPPFPGPERRARQRLEAGQRRCSPPDAMEIRFVEGALLRAGPGDRLVPPARTRCSPASRSVRLERRRGRGRLRQRHQLACSTGTSTCSSTRTSRSTSSARRSTSGSRCSSQTRIARGQRRESPRACCTTARGRIGHAMQSLLVAPRRRPPRYLRRKALMRTSYCWASRAVDAVGERLDDRQQRGVRAHERRRVRRVVQPDPGQPGDLGQRRVGDGQRRRLAVARELHRAGDQRMRPAGREADHERAARRSG